MWQLYRDIVARRVRTVCGLALVLGVLAVGWLFSATRQALSKSDPRLARAAGRPIPVKLATVANQEIHEVIGGTCVTRGSGKASVHLKAADYLANLWVGQYQFSGFRIKRVLARQGEAVRAGQILLELDDELYRSFEQEMKLRLEAAERAVAYQQKRGNVNAALRQLHVSRQEARLARAASAERKQGGEPGSAEHRRSFAEEPASLSSADGRDPLGQDAEQELGRLRQRSQSESLQEDFDLQQAIYERDLNKGRLQRLTQGLEMLQLRTPVDGFVERIESVPGQLVSGGGSLADVLILDPIWVQMDFPQEQIPEVKIGQQADIVLDCFPNDRFAGSVLAILPQVSIETRVLPVIIEVRNPDHRIKAGVSGFTRLTVVREALAVPSRAVVQGAHAAMVFCVDHGRSWIRQVQVGPLAESGMMEVRGGLSAGESVVIFNTEYLNDGDAVDTDWKTWARRE